MKPALPLRLVPILATLSIGVLASVLAGCAPPQMTLHAPKRIEQALSVASELEATATLVPRGGKALAGQPLARGDDGVTFSGFLATAPGEYTLEVVFTGVVATPAGRHFLGRLTSDAFTVTQGSTTTPTFSAAVDTVGRAGDGGDDDNDKLGFLDELLLGTDPTLEDSDGDGVADGQDCGPADNQNTFVILAGGTFEDCDADGFRAVTAPLGDPGQDCDDENALVNPGVHDDCTNTVDEDCNPQTCPIADFDGPTVDVVSPVDGSTIGCNAPFVVHASDPSDIASAFMTAPDAPLAGGTQRIISLIADDDNLTWRGPNGFGFTGGGMVDGPFAVDVKAFDNASNATTVHAQYTLALAYPDITMTGPDSIVAGPAVHIDVATHGAHPLVSLELRAAAFDPSTTQLDLSTEQVLGALPLTGGGLDVDPAALPGNAVVYPVAVDDVGNTMSPLPLGASFSSSFGINSGYFCDGQTHYVPAISKRGDITGPVTALAHLQEATDVATALAPTAFLTQVIAFGIDATGHIDLSRTDDSSIMIIYDFMTPEAVLANGSNAEGPAVIWYSAGIPLANPQVNSTGSFILDEIARPDLLIDSDVVAAAWPCGGPGIQGTSNDYIQYQRDVNGAIPGTDTVAIRPANTDYSWTTDATNLSSANGFCCLPTGCQ